MERRSEHCVAGCERDQAYDRQRDQISGHRRLLFENKDAADRGRRDRFGREPYPSESQGAAAAVATSATPRTGPFARAGQYFDFDCECYGVSGFAHDCGPQKGTDDAPRAINAKRSRTFRCADHRPIGKILDSDDKARVRFAAVAGAVLNALVMSSMMSSCR
jgi:hypothetical protein